MATPFEGIFDDVKHPGCPRVIQFLEDEVTVKVCGHDGDANAPWTGSGKLNEQGNLVIDLSTKGGPSELEGKWTGTGIVWVRDGNHVIENDGKDMWPLSLADLPL